MYKLVIYIMLMTPGILLLTLCNKEEPLKVYKTPMPEYTAKNSRELSDISKEHIPKIEINPGKSTENVLVYVKLDNPSERHYIEVIGIMDMQGKDIVEPVRFNRVRAVSYYGRFTVESLTEDYKVYAKCNLHNLWTAPLVRSGNE